jgi:hypothetical protein
MTLRRIRKLLGILDENDEGRFGLGDASRLDAVFAGCTAALDLNPRIRGEWAGFSFRLEEDWLLRRRDSHVPEDRWGGLLVAFRTTSTGTTHLTPSWPRFPGKSLGFVEQAVFVPSEERWVVIR